MLARDTRDAERRRRKSLGERMAEDPATVNGAGWNALGEMCGVLLTYCSDHQIRSDWEKFREDWERFRESRQVPPILELANRLPKDFTQQSGFKPPYFGSRNPLCGLRVGVLRPDWDALEAELTLRNRRCLIHEECREHLNQGVACFRLNPFAGADLGLLKTVAWTGDIGTASESRHYWAGQNPDFYGWIPSLPEPLLVFEDEDGG